MQVAKMLKDVAYARKRNLETGKLYKTLLSPVIQVEQCCRPLPPVLKSEVPNFVDRAVLEAAAAFSLWEVSNQNC